MPIIDPTKEIKIFTRNFIDSDTTIVSSHGGTTSYVYDRDKETKWTSWDGGDDGTPVTLTFTFNVGSTETEFTLNTLLILNTNIKAVTMEKWSGSAWVFVFSDEANSDVGCWSFGAVKTSRIRLTFTTTQSANKEKYAGEIILARLRYVLDTGFSSYELLYREKKAQIDLGDGGQSLAYTRAPGSRTNRYGARCSFQFLSRADYEKLLCLKDEGEPFLWYPEAVTRPGEIWFVNWVTPFSAKYTTLFTGNGYDLTMELQEV